MQNEQIIQRIQAIYSKGVPSDDSRLTSRHIYSKMITLRAKLLTQELGKKKTLSPWNYQLLPCIELIDVPLEMCPCVPPSGCTIKRSKHQIPPILNGLYGLGIRGVYTLARKEISQIDIAHVEYMGGGRYTKASPKYFIHDNYLYILNSPVQVVSLSAIFDDPIAASTFENKCSNKDCKDCGKCIDVYKMEFPLSSDLVDVLIELAKQELVMPFLTIPQDNRNNTNDERLVKPENGE